MMIHRKKPSLVSHCVWIFEDKGGIMEYRYIMKFNNNMIMRKLKRMCIVVLS